MRALHRNQLVWLSEAAWQRVRARAWDAQAQSILAHWHLQRLPLVVCRQRVPERYDSISLGLPAPLQWDRRKLALEVLDADIEQVGHFPLLTPALLGPAHVAELQDFLHHLAELHVTVRVYGSHGWQQLTGLPCVRDGSDLDLIIEVPVTELAGQAVWLLRGLRTPCRADGELQFPDGSAVAWREYAQLIGGKVERVLVKSRTGVHLSCMESLQAMPC